MTFLYALRNAVSALRLRCDRESISLWKDFNSGATKRLKSWGGRGEREKGEEREGGREGGRERGREGREGGSEGEREKGGREGGGRGEEGKGEGEK